MNRERPLVVAGGGVRLPLCLQCDGKIEFKFRILPVNDDRRFHERHSLAHIAANNQSTPEKTSRDRAVLTAVERVAEKRHAVAPDANLNKTQRSQDANNERAGGRQDSITRHSGRRKLGDEPDERDEQADRWKISE